MKRRTFIAALGSAAAWPFVVRAQQPERMKRIAVLMGTASTGQSPAAYDAFLRRLGELGWTDGRNVRIEVRWANGDPELMRSYGTDLAGQSPDVFLVQSNPALAALRPLAGNSLLDGGLSPRPQRNYSFCGPHQRGRWRCRSIWRAVPFHQRVTRCCKSPI